MSTQKGHVARLLVVAASWLVSLGVGTAAAQTLPPLRHEKYTLANGLEVILHQDTSVPLVSVNVWYKVGSGDEQPGRTGFAHLFEHVMFMGSQNVPVGQFDVWLESAGARNNGTTDEDRTLYYEDLPSNALALALWLEADRMGWLLPTMDQEKLDIQRGVVQNERRQGVDNVPYGRAYETIVAALFPKDHPYSWDVIGSLADLSAASLDDVQGFFRKYYAPNNASIAIAGDFAMDEAKALVNRFFSAIPRGPAIDRRASVPAPAITRDTFLVLEDHVQLPRVYYTWPSVKIYGAGDAERDVLAYVLAGDKTSRLYKRLVYELQVAQDVEAFQSGHRMDGLFQISVTPKPGQQPETLARLVNEEMQKIARAGITAGELERAQSRFLSQFLDGLASVNGKAFQLNHYNYFVGNPDWVRQDAARYSRVTAADVQRAAAEQFAKPKVVLTVVPQGQTQLMVKGGAQ
ncbi:MAG: M16 family metallopeptidase [Longimicrobiales bacterium]